MAAKYIELSKIITKRLKEGVYTIKAFPTEREMTEEFNISRNTARKIFDQLIDAGYLMRTPNKSVEVCPKKSLSQIAFLTPSIYSEFFERLKFSLEHAVDQGETQIHHVSYLNWEDPMFHDVLKNFDAVFVVPLPEEIPNMIKNQMVTSPASVVVFERDLRELGIPSIITMPHFFVQHLMDHLSSLGHRHIDCINTQNVDDIILGRIQQWQVWNSLHGGKGTLHQKPVEHYGCPMEQGYQVAKALLAQKNHSKAFICLTEPCAIGVCKAMWESGLEPGKDISLATFESQLARYIHPGLTCIKFPDPSPYIKICLDWIKRGSRDWEGPLLLQAQESSIFEGGSCVISTKN
jgi:LacI family transcriptional regulator